jgi:hypothetical protein
MHHMWKWKHSGNDSYVVGAPVVLLILGHHWRVVQHLTRATLIYKLYQQIAHYLHAYRHVFPNNLPNASPNTFPNASGAYPGSIIVYNDVHDWNAWTERPLVRLLNDREVDAHNARTCSLYASGRIVACLICCKLNVPHVCFDAHMLTMLHLRY